MILLLYPSPEKIQKKNTKEIAWEKWIEKFLHDKLKRSSFENELQNVLNFHNRITLMNAKWRWMQVENQEKENEQKDEQRWFNFKITA